MQECIGHLVASAEQGQTTATVVFYELIDGTHDWLVPTGAIGGSIDGNGGSTTQSFTITVAAGNDVPNITSVPRVTTLSGQPFTFQVAAVDSDGDSIALGAAGLPAWLRFADNGNGTATLSGTPARGDAGSHAVTLTASDGRGGTSSQILTIDVATGNEAPVFSSPGAAAATSGQAFSFRVAASDADGDTAAITAASLPTWMRLTDNGNGTATLSGIPARSDAGSRTIVLTASDGQGGTATQELTVTVAAVNGAPAFSSAAAAAPVVGQPFSFRVTTTDPDGDSRSVTAGGLPAKQGMGLRQGPG